MMPLTLKKHLTLICQHYLKNSEKKIMWYTYLIYSSQIFMDT